MKMNQFIETLKQQPRQGQQAFRDQQAQRGRETGQVAPQLPSMSTPGTNASTTSAITDQVRQLAQQLANQMVAEQQQTQILARNGFLLLWQNQKYKNKLLIMDQPLRSLKRLMYLM